MTIFQIVYMFRGSTLVFSALVQAWWNEAFTSRNDDWSQHHLKTCILIHSTEPISSMGTYRLATDGLVDQP
jgi:hypothetical protein